MAAGHAPAADLGGGAAAGGEEVVVSAIGVGDDVTAVIAEEIPRPVSGTRGGEVEEDLIGSGIAPDAGDAAGSWCGLQKAGYARCSSTKPSRSKTCRISSNLAEMFPLGNRICPSPWMFENSAQVSSNSTMAFVKPRRP